MTGVQTCALPILAPLAGRAGATIMLAPYPQPEPALVDEAAGADIEWLKQVIVAVRNIRGELGIAPGRQLPLLARNGVAEDRRRLAEHRELVHALAKLESSSWLDGADAPPAAAQVVGQLELLVPLAGLIDVAAELVRLTREADKLGKEVERLAAKLGNPGFTAKAPAEVVAKERARLAEISAQRDTLLAQLASLDGVS